MAFDRAAAERKLRSAERDLATLGKVNPLALEEFAALEERHAFLSTQLADLKDTRRDLLTVVGEVDQKIQDVFAGAFPTSPASSSPCSRRCSPAARDRLVLTDPDDMLTTGIEVNARPPGKKVKRLSLLSGGERSLTAVAILVSIFRARPSPFYVMDEVEAALDEVNLTRLVTLLSELRESSQLIIITHQKFTMEAADALYGVSMRGDGITQVISQRIRGVVATPASSVRAADTPLRPPLRPAWARSDPGAHRLRPLADVGTGDQTVDHERVDPELLDHSCRGPSPRKTSSAPGFSSSTYAPVARTLPSAINSRRYPRWAAR